MNETVHEPVNRNLNTLVCKHCSFQWSFVDRKAWSENCPKRMEQTIKALLDLQDKRDILLRSVEAILGQIDHLAAVEESRLDEWTVTLAGTAVSRVRELRKAFIGYVEDSHRRRDEPMPPVIGLCVTCHFPVYESEHGGLFHYTYDSTKVCARAAIPENGV